MNDPVCVPLIQYLLTEYLIQGISSLSQAVLTFRQAGLFQGGPDNLVGCETCFSPSFLRATVCLSYPLLSGYLCAVLFSLAFLYLFHSLHWKYICISISCHGHPAVFFCSAPLFFLNLSCRVVSQVLTLDSRRCSGVDRALSQ